MTAKKIKTNVEPRPRKISKKDQDILRRLAGRQAEIAQLPVQESSEMEWRRVNALKPGRPLVWIDGIPWPEMDVGDELTCRTEDEFCRGVEWQFRTTLYRWEHLRGDMVVEPVFYSPIVIRDTGFGIEGKSRPAGTGGRAGTVPAEGHPQIRCLADIDRIRTPEVTVDEDASTLNYEVLCKLFKDILRVESYGIGAQRSAPWDDLIRWWGVEQAMVTMALRPELVHAALDRLVSAHLRRLDQYQQLNLLSLNNGNVPVGSGGLGFTDELPQKDFDPGTVTTKDQWGAATARIFSEVSPEMHWDFALQYEMRWLERFGLACYDGGEPVGAKLGLLGKIPNLRKLSMSTRGDPEKAAPHMVGRYVFSHQPDPAVLAADRWQPEQARRALRAALEAPCRSGCAVEVILSDVHTVRRDPTRLWEWADMARDVAAGFG